MLLARRYSVLLVAGLFLATAAFAAQPPSSTAERLLFDAANRDRAALGLPQLQWDDALASAARMHTMRMAQQNALSHQFPNELSLQDRATQFGARFSIIAENVAEGPSASGIHTQWMNSPPHRANLLDAQLSAVGIAVMQSHGELFAVEDFSQAVAKLTLDAQELQVSSLIVSRGLRIVNDLGDARKTCDTERGSAGNRPSAVIRYETTDLKRLPDEIEQKLQSGKYRAAAVGACGAAGVARFRVAILLF